jgi:large conductance mechanosensitive channel
MLKGFRDFLLRGNVIDLAVAVIIGAAFGTIVTAIAEGIIAPLIAPLLGFADVSTLNQGNFKWGDVLNAIINFLITAAVIYFVIIMPMNRAVEYLKSKEPAPAAPELTVDQKLLTEIRDALREQRVPLRSSNSGD